jgi:tRNA U34 5-methylaminomethyl-2-thiouridine-forming methyltransferase MnmC
MICAAYAKKVGRDLKDEHLFVFREYNPKIAQIRAFTHIAFMKKLPPFYENISAFLPEPLHAFHRFPFFSGPVARLPFFLSSLSSLFPIPQSGLDCHRFRIRRIDPIRLRQL